MTLGCWSNSTCSTLNIDIRHVSACPAGNRTRVGSEHSSKELFKQLVSSYLEHQLVTVLAIDGPMIFMYWSVPLCTLQFAVDF
jgi:hypothetical protein